MSDVMVTVNGYVGTKPLLYRSEATGAEWTSFRVGSTRRVVNRTTGEWSDGPTLWFTVKAWNHAARNVVESLAKGDPVSVHGRLGVEEWEGTDHKTHTSLVVSAASVGPDVTRGVARFTRVITTSAAPDGAPGDGLAAASGPGEGGEDPWSVPAAPDGLGANGTSDEDDAGDPSGVGRGALVTA